MAVLIFLFIEPSASSAIELPHFHARCSYPFCRRPLPLPPPPPASLFYGRSKGDFSSRSRSLPPRNESIYRTRLQHRGCSFYRSERVVPSYVAYRGSVLDDTSDRALPLLRTGSINRAWKWPGRVVLKKNRRSPSSRQLGKGAEWRWCRCIQDKCGNRLCARKSYEFASLFSSPFHEGKCSFRFKGRNTITCPWRCQRKWWMRSFISVRECPTSTASANRTIQIVSLCIKLRWHFSNARAFNRVIVSSREDGDRGREGLPF